MPSVAVGTAAVSLPLRPAPWDSVISSACSEIKRWNAVKSDGNFSSAFPKLSHLSLVAAASFSMPEITAVLPPKALPNCDPSQFLLNCRGGSLCGQRVSPLSIHQG
ncbi:hypothetical protein Tsp_11311 [Trichinella spiralis]|uniref:hypothetical protein n=1 Tax=Trichinella spiralis TaxID=6334 RepID=UPI0001EFEF1D|nr:hypothetical protein Tsp_11311 [Trichinella spiralis]